MPLLLLFVGSLGGGKSFCNNLLVYYSVLFGGQAVILDPKSERGNWKETLPEIAHEINIVNLTSDKDNAGLLDPFVIMKNVKDAESLAIDILTFLTGISSRDGEKFPVLRKAVRSVTQSDSRGLLHVIDELRRGRYASIKKYRRPYRQLHGLRLCTPAVFRRYGGKCYQFR